MMIKFRDGPRDGQVEWAKMGTDQYAWTENIDPPEATFMVPTPAFGPPRWRVGMYRKTNEQVTSSEGAGWVTIFQWQGWQE